MSSKIGIHWTPAHRDDRDWDIMTLEERRAELDRTLTALEVGRLSASDLVSDDHWQALVAADDFPAVEIWEHAISDPFFIEKLYAAAPTSMIVFRDIALSNSNDAMQADPAGLANQHAAHWTEVFQRLAGVKNFNPWRTIACGVNEPIARSQAEIANTVIYYATFLDALRNAGIRGGALRLSVGWPDNTGPDTAVDWRPFTPVRDAIRRGQHYLLVNEYWDIQGPQENLGWWADRLGQCPWQVPIIVTECGVDRYVRSANYEGSRGWAGHLSKEEYLAQIEWYDDRMRADSRVLGCNLFTYDFGNNEWHSFDVRPLREELIAYRQRKAGAPAPESLPVPRYPPEVTPPQPKPLREVLIEEGDRRQAIQFNPNAALQKKIFAHGFVPNSAEFELTHAGTSYACQRAEHLASGEVRIYYAALGDWANVKHVTK